MDISIDDLKGLLSGNSGTPFRIGQKLFMRTVTYHITGEVVAIDGDFLTLKGAAWIADSGRFSDAIKSCEFSEVEPLPDGWMVNVTAITDCGPINRLPREQK